MHKVFGIVILMIVYMVGLVGMVSPSQQEWYIEHSPHNLILSFILLCIYHKNFNKGFFIFLISAFSIGMVAEIAGVATGLIFGGYNYGSGLGYQVGAVPLIIGINWFILAYSTGCIAEKLPKTTGIYTKAGVAAFLMVALDALIEPIASKLDFWHWEGDIIPIQNYIAWFVIGFGIQLIYQKLDLSKKNAIAPYVYGAMVIFFFGLNLFLK